MEIKVKKENFYKLAQKIFDFVEIKKGYPIMVPISNHHIYINNILCFLDDDAKHYLSINSYGQMSIVRERDDHQSNRICFDLADLKSLRFHARNFGGKINKKNGKYYNEPFDFSFY